MNLEKIKKILGEATLNETQINALEEFFKQYTEEVKKSVGYAEGVDMIPKAVAERAFNNFQKDAEKAFNLRDEDSKKAFNLFKEDAEKAFNLFKEDSQKAFELYSEDLQNEYTENMIKGLQDLYVDIQERVKKDFFESKDAMVLEQVKKSVMPLIVSQENQVLMEEIEKLRSEKEKIVTESKELSRENIINSLVKDFPETYVEEVRTFISGAKSEDEIYERFSTICEMIDKGVIADKKAKVVENKKEEKKIVTEEKSKIKKTITEELNQTKTIKSKSTEPVLKPVEKSFFSEEEDALMQIIYSS